MATDPPPRNRWPSPFAVVLWAAALYVFITSYTAIYPIIVAFLLMLLISLALNPAVANLRRMMGGRSRATAVVMLMIVVIVALTAWGVYRPVKASMSKFIQRLPDYWERVQKPLLKMEEKAAVSEEKLKREVRTEIKEEVERTNAPPAEERAVRKVQSERNAAPSAADAGQGGFMRSTVSQALGGVGGAFKTLASNAATTLMIAITVFVGTIFTLLNPRPLVSFLFASIPERHHEKAARIAGRIVAMIPRWALATILGMSTIGTMVFLSMWVILGFQDALVLGLIAFVLEAVPYIGPILAVVPAVLLGIGQGGLTPLWVIIAYATIQLLENNLIMPVIVAGRLRLHPLAALFSILICVSLFGVLGVIMAIPFVAIAGILHEELLRPKLTPNVSDDDLEEKARAVLNRETDPEHQRKLGEKSAKKARKAK